MLAALWLVTCTPAAVHGQNVSTSSPPAGAKRAAPVAVDRGGVKLPGAPPVTKDSPTTPHAEDSSEVIERVAPEKGHTLPKVQADSDPAPGDSAAAGAAPDQTDRGFHWKSATEQAVLFLGIQHGYAVTQPKTRRDLRGPFFRDYFRSVKSLHGWADGGRFFTNYVAHPMEGALLGFVWVQNDPKGKAAPFGRSKAYWRSRAKAFAWSAAWSTQFELGPVSQASLGNVGLHGKQTWVDIVVTPVGGTAWLVAEDALDRHLVRRIERRTDNRFARIIARMIFNPTRSSANLLRFEKPWRRDR
jgi:hypothetical protein